jgi:hypothetical protein
MTTTSGAASPELKFGQKQSTKGTIIKPIPNPNNDSVTEESKAERTINHRKKNDKSVINEETEQGKFANFINLDVVDSGDEQYTVRILR